jgi:hypothetical protein
MLGSFVEPAITHPIVLGGTSNSGMPRADGGLFDSGQ